VGIPWPTIRISPWRFSNDNTGSDEQDHGHEGYGHRCDGEYLEERPEMSRCWSLFGVNIGVCFTNARYIFVKGVEERSRFSHPVINDKGLVFSEPTYMRWVSGYGHGSYVL